MDNPRRLGGTHLPHEVDVIVAAHSHAFITADAVAKAGKAAIGYHPSLLPRHRGIAAVEWTIKCGDPIAGGSVYHLSDSLDGGMIAAQDWCSSIPTTMPAACGAGRSLRWACASSPRWSSRSTGYGFAEAREQDPKAVTHAPAMGEHA